MVSTQVSNNFIIHRSLSLKETIQYLKVVTDHLISSHQEIKTQHINGGDHEGFLGDEVDARFPTTGTVLLSAQEESSTVLLMILFPDGGLWEINKWSEMVSKSGNLATSDIFAKQLLQINGVSGVRAKAIVDCYHSPLQLAHAYDACENHRQRMLLLKDLPCLDKKLGAALSQRICEFYWPLTN